MEFNHEIFAENVRELIEANNLKIGSVEKKTEFSPGYISRIEKRKEYPHVQFIMNLSEILHVSPAKLLKPERLNLNENKMLLNKLIDKLKKDTEQNNIIWKTRNSIRSKTYTTMIENELQIYITKINNEKQEIFLKATEKKGHGHNHTLAGPKSEAVPDIRELIEIIEKTNDIQKEMKNIIKQYIEKKG